MKRAFSCTILFTVSILFLLHGCAGKTKSFIPDNIPKIGKNKARIIMTRERQIAGAASSMVVIDIGEGIDSNALIALKEYSIEDIQQRENIASMAGTSISFLWYDQKMVNPLYCPNKESGCIQFDELKWPRKKFSPFLFGSGVFLSYSCESNILQHTARDFVALDIIRKGESNLVNVHRCYKGRGHTIKSNPHGYDIPELSGYYMLSIVQEPRMLNGLILTGLMVDHQRISSKVQVVGAMKVGDTLIWDRNPGMLRLGAVWYDGVGFMPKNIRTEPGKTYYIHYTTRFGQRWELKGIE